MTITTPPAPLDPAKGRVAPDVAPGGVCVAILPSEKPVRLQSESAGDFLPQLDQSTLAWVNFTVKDLRKDGSQVATLLGFSGTLVETLLESPYGNYEDREVEFGLRMPMARVRGGELESTPLLVLVRWGLVVTLQTPASAERMVRLTKRADAFMRKIPHDEPMPDKLTVLLTRLVNDNNERNFEALRVIQNQGDLISAELLEGGEGRERIGKQVYDVKHLLVQYLDALWASLDAIQSLRYGDAELITDDERLLARVGILSDDVTRQIQLSEHTTEVLVSGLEVLQSVYNNQLQELNNQMAMAFTWLTILGTVILVPNTIATIFGPLRDYEGQSFALYVVFMVGATLLATWFTWNYIQRAGFIERAQGLGGQDRR